MTRRAQIRTLTITVILFATAATRAGAQIPKSFGNFLATKADSTPGDNTVTSSAFSTETAAWPDAAIAWRCMPDGLNVVYLPGRAFDDVADITLRTHVDDDEPSQELRWAMLEGHRAVFLPLPLVLTFTERAIAGKRLTLDVIHPVTGSNYSEEFSLAGLSGALDYILPCGE